VLRMVATFGAGVLAGGCFERLETNTLGRAKDRRQPADPACAEHNTAHAASMAGCA
jgi:hypothetical protein